MPPNTYGGWSSGLFSEGLVPQYFDVSFYIVKLLLYNSIQTVVFDKCNIQFVPCTLPLQFLLSYINGSDNRRPVSSVGRAPVC